MVAMISTPSGKATEASEDISSIQRELENVSSQLKQILLQQSNLEQRLCSLSQKSRPTIFGQQWWCKVKEWLTERGSADDPKFN